MNAIGKLLFAGVTILAVLLVQGCTVVPVSGHVSYGYYGGYSRPYYRGPGYIGRPPIHRPPGHRPPGNRPPKPVQLPALPPTRPSPRGRR